VELSQNKFKNTDAAKTPVAVERLIKALFAVGPLPLLYLRENCSSVVALLKAYKYE